ncbi:MAG: hypothetical protein COY40_02570 [Alphaproteobacteria bacterium CG_4_10_14_0_8_um_filter_53_9]|nr:MAG: hypothetical protein COY40_02570 [Alphaproteobacteria bacterium CG_4_10_14_0_8_um_filter_53_9]
MAFTELDELTNVAAYLKRVGAEVVNFKSACVKVTENGYPRTTGWIKFNTTAGTVKASGDVDPPTEAEALAIAEELKTAKFPHPVALSAMADSPKGLNPKDDNVFVFHDFQNRVVMLQERVETPDGKMYIPWTRWSDGKWRKMEPEDHVPFYGLPGAKDHSVLFIHEGPKAVQKIKKLISGEAVDDRFPWLEYFRWGAHVGWIGGVHSMDRSDWASLARMNWKKVVIVADNDNMGKAVVPKIAQHFHVPTYSIVFNDLWPTAFDLADKWPDEMFGDVNNYIGPSIEHCIEPATWCTDEFEIIGAGGRPKIVHEARDVFCNQWVWIEQQDLIVNLDMPQYRMSTAHFNSFCRPFSHVGNTAQLFQKSYAGSQMKLTYDPSKVGTLIRDAAGLGAINLYQPSPIKPEEGDWEPFLEFMEYLVPGEEDRDHLLQWIATLVACPWLRIVWGILMMSEQQGTGKTTLGTILAELVGRNNSSFPGENMIVGSDFNGWIANKRLIVVNEIYSGHSWKAYNKLKPYVSDDEIEVNIKFEPTYTQPNWTHYYLCSNSTAALKLEDGDRRWLVPKVTEKKWPKEKFAAFHKWLRAGGFARIAFWAKTYEQRGGKYLDRGQEAPMSSSKKELIEESRSDAEKMTRELAEAIAELGPDAEVAIPILWIKSWLVDRLNDQVYESPRVLANILSKCGMFTTDRVKMGTKYHRLVVNKEPMAGWIPARLREAVRKPDDILKDEF